MGDGAGILIQIPDEYYRAEMAAQGVELDVLFMTRTVSYRKWNFSTDDMPFRSRIVRGLHMEVGPFAFHFNPGIVRAVSKYAPDWLIVGGTWWMPTSVASILAAARVPGCKIVMHLEANRYAMTHRAGPVATLRRCATWLANSAPATPGRRWLVFAVSSVAHARESSAMYRR